MTVGLEIVERLNFEDEGEKKPFEVEGDITREPCYAYMFRVRCIFCVVKFELVPTVRNLEHNLRQHLSSQEHVDSVLDDFEPLLSVLVRTGSKGRPKKIDGRDTHKHKDIRSMFSVQLSSGSQHSYLEDGMQNETPSLVSAERKKSMNAVQG